MPARIIPAEAASASDQLKGRAGSAGVPVQQKTGARDASSGLTGTGQLTRGPIRRA